MEQHQEPLRRQQESTVWLLSCEGPADPDGQTDFECVAFIGVFTTEEGALRAEQEVRKDRDMQTYVDAYLVDELNWVTEFTVE